MPATVSAEPTSRYAAKPAPARARAGARRRREQRADGSREARGIAARWPWRASRPSSLAVFDPRAAPRPSSGTSVGPVGAWLGWALFRALGYAGFLLPLLLGAWGVSAFVRPRRRARLGPAGRARGAPARGGGPARAASDTFVAQRVTRGGIRGRRRLGGLGAPRALRARSAQVGTWLLLLARVPVGVLLRHPGLVRGAVARLVDGPSRRSCAAQRAGQVPAPPVWRSVAAAAGASPAEPDADEARRAAAGRRGAAQAARPPRGARASPGRRRSTSARAARSPSSCRRSACSSRRPPRGAASARARSSQDNAETLRKQAPGLRGRRPHRAGEPGARHHLVRVRAGGRASR